MGMTIIPDFSGILLSILPPGAFMALGFLIAIKRLIDRWAKVRQERSAARDLIAIEP